MLRSLAAAAILALASSTFAQPLSTAFTYQAELDTAGAAATGLYDFRFTLYDAEAGGTQLGPQLCSDNISVTNGHFTAQLDFGAQFAGQQRFLEVWVRQDTGLTCANSIGYTTLSPRQNLTASPNAVFALNAATAASAASSTNASQFNGQAPSFYTNAANLSSGSIPSARLAGSYSSTLNLTNASNTFAGSGAALSNLNASSISTGTLNPILFPIPFFLGGTDATGIVNSTNFATSGLAAGFYGKSESTSGSGDATASPTPPQGFNYGVYGLTNSIGGVGGYFTSPGDAMWAITSGTGKSCVVGIHGGTGAGFGLYGQANGTTGVGVFGRVYNTSGAPTMGVFGQSDSTSGTAVYGHATATSGQTYGILGQASPNGWAVYSQGDFGSSGLKSFRIDHPADPENKYLLHYCSESPEPLNFYSGKSHPRPAGLRNDQPPAPLRQHQQRPPLLHHRHRLRNAPPPHRNRKNR